MKLKRKITMLLIILIAPLLMGASYNYSYHGEVLHSSPGYNYITHFNQQTLGIQYSDPKDFKVYNEKIYLLTQNLEKNKDLLVILNSDFEVENVIDEFHLTDSYKEKVSLEVENTFISIKELYEDLFSSNKIYSNTILPFDQIGEIIELIDYEWKSSEPSIISNEGLVEYSGDEEVFVEIELTLSLLNNTRTYMFNIEISPEVDGIIGNSKEVLSYEVEEHISIETINDVIGINIDNQLYFSLLDFLELNIIETLENPNNHSFEYNEFLISFKNSGEEELTYENIIFTKVINSEDSSNIHATLFDPIYKTNRAQGLDVVDSGIYIADTDNNRIIKLNHDFEVIDGFFGVDDETFNNHVYRPMKITVDTSERMYVIASGVYEGILELDSNGDFNRYTGVNPIKLSPLEVFRRLLMTESQKAKLERFLPTDYTSVSLNEKSFIYATAKPTSGNDENMIQLINPKGVDVLKRNGYYSPMGDIMYVSGRNNYVIDGPSDLVDVAIGENGIYSVLDSKRSRIFTYDDEGNLLYINGDKGFQSDKFSHGVAINYFGENLVVLDSSGTMIVYRPTEFGESVNKAVEHQKNGDFLEASVEWENVLRLNTNYEVAYNGIGRYNLHEGNYKEAMRNFKLGHHQNYYSKAFKLQRNIVIRENFTLIISAIIVVIGGTVGTRKYLKHRRGKLK